MVIDSQTACLEVGIEFGTLYRQFADTPVSPDSARDLERAMAEATESQLHCGSVSVHAFDDALDAELVGPTADCMELMR